MELKAQRKEIIEEIEGMKYKTKPNRYDGDSLKSACDFYSISADTWEPIIRYEDGHDEAINKVISHLNNK